MWQTIFLYIFGLLWVIEAGLLIFSPVYSKKICSAYLKVPIWFWGLIYVAFAFLLWFSTSASLSPCLVKAMALFALWKGLFLLLVPAKDLQKTIDWSLSFSETTYRILGILLLPVAIYFLLRII